MDAQFWDDEYRSNPDHTIVPDRFLVDAITSLTPGSALDLGCGIGHNALMLAERGWRVHGIDWSEQAIKLATEAAETHGLDASFEVADLSTWRSDNSLDLVINTYALPIDEDGLRLIELAAHSLRPGGTLIIVEWDQSMADVWGFAEDELWSAKKLMAALSEPTPALRVESCEVQHVPDLFLDPTDMRAQAGPSANVIVAVAVKQP